MILVTKLLMLEDYFCHWIYANGSKSNVVLNSDNHLGSMCAVNLPQNVATIFY